MRLRLAALALLLPVSVACGSADVQKLTALEVVKRASGRTVEAGSARIAMSLSGGGVTMNGEGVSSLTENKMAMTTTMDMMGQQVVMEMRMLGDVMYMKLPPMPGAKSGKPWLKLDLAELAKASGTQAQALTQMRQNDPTQALEYLAGVSDDIREDGKEDVRGTATTRYRGTLNLEKAKEGQASPEVKDALDEAIKRLGVATIPATVWIDDDGRLRKLVYDFDLSKLKEAAAAGATGTMTTTFEMFDFGVPVDVAAPPAAETGDGSALLQGQ